ncbi:MAG: fumarate hydratase C-terminal domain-containing protein [Alphaproteobacteria bacterium]|nr:fumarate hydratase C-terminal domain-containing protein [Alphaproteobacteria bacterium]
MSNIHELSLPLQPDDITPLQIGDLVYLTGEIIVTVGLPTHKRIAEFVDAGKELPMDLSNGMLCQVGCYVETQGNKQVSRYINPSTSTRFEPYLPTIIGGTGVRMIGGKGGVGPKTIEAMKAYGCVYVSFIGGASALTSEAVRDVLEVAWHDFIPQFRLTRLKVERLGPLTVGVDVRGNCLYTNLKNEAKGKLDSLMEELNRDRA